MKYYILKLTLNGIKNIDKKIELNFYKNNLSKDMNNLNQTHVKGIYGANGVGKTGIVYAMDIYKNLVVNPSYLVLGNSNGSIKNLINQNSRTLDIEVTFACLKDNILMNTYIHSIKLGESNGIFKIIEEKLIEIKSKKINNTDKYKVMFHTKNGQIEELDNSLSRECKDHIINKTLNLIDSKSFLYLYMININQNNMFNSNMIEQMYNIFGFFLSITVILQDSDKEYINFDSVSQQIDTISKYKNNLQDYDLFLQLLQQNIIPQNKTEKILKNAYISYQKYVKNLERFIKVFRNDLKTIEIKKEENGQYYECELILVYKNGYRINKKYESTGIKKIITLYSALCDLEKGNIVFIDEFDANIHDVLLLKLIEYIVEYASGQFVFTCHNLEPMEVLKKQKFSIDFLTMDSRIVSWTTNGNYSPASLYKKGLVEGSPFNLESVNFLGVFGDEE